MGGITLGSVYVDTVSGFTGVATAHCDFLHGPPRTELTPVGDGGKTPEEPRWFDDSRITLQGAP